MYLSAMRPTRASRTAASGMAIRRLTMFDVTSDLRAAPRRSREGALVARGAWLVRGANVRHDLTVVATLLEPQAEDSARLHQLRLVVGIHGQDAVPGRRAAHRMARRLATLLSRVRAKATYLPPFLAASSFNASGE